MLFLPMWNKSVCLSQTPTAVSIQEPMMCAGCGEQVCDRFFLLAAGRVWHSVCLRCSQCHCELQTHPSLYWRDGNIYCQQDYCRSEKTILLLLCSPKCGKFPDVWHLCDFSSWSGCLEAVSALAASSQSQLPLWSWGLVSWPSILTASPARSVCLSRGKLWCSNNK